MSQTQFVKFRQNMLDKSLDPYREHLKNHAAGLVAKRVFDIFASLLCIIVMFPFFLIAVAMVKTTKGPFFTGSSALGKTAANYTSSNCAQWLSGPIRAGKSQWAAPTAA